jgi:hypothetical protein
MLLKMGVHFNKGLAKVVIHTVQRSHHIRECVAAQAVEFKELKGRERWALMTKRLLFLLLSLLVLVVVFFQELDCPWHFSEEMPPADCVYKYMQYIRPVLNLVCIC